ncbi:DUF3883 domain-containing protein [Winogradskyella sp.]|uniref:DUF3883 domain-containing protein n=1 Tax=Winogradskyella sp. TaxID=1883156 RepID=UPI002616D551|nr:DUF3883 domain-containing protein [Winogradskyella sp.]
MKVCAVDLANLCVIYRNIGSRYLNGGKLESILRNNMRLSAMASPKDVISEAQLVKLISHDQNRDFYVISKLGLLIADGQKEIQNEIVQTASKLLLKDVYLNHENNIQTVRDIFSRMDVDNRFSTFVYNRKEEEENDETIMLMRLSELRLLEHKENKILVNREYIHDVNEYLHALRQIQRMGYHADSQFRNEIGKLAEQLAKEYEAERLRSLGYSELIPFITHYGGVDDSKGYDIQSYTITDKGVVNEVMIEVKGSMHDCYQLYWSKNEREVAKEIGFNYWIYCYKNVDLKKRTAEGPYVIRNSYYEIEHSDKYDVEAAEVFVKVN